MNGKTIFQILVILVLAAISMPVQGQTDQSAESTAMTTAESMTGIIEDDVVDNNGNKIGLKVGISYPPTLKEDEWGILLIDLTTNDFGHTGYPDTETNLEYGTIKIAYDEKMRFGDGSQLLIAPKDDWYEYGELLKESDDLVGYKTIGKLMEVIPVVDFFVSTNDILGWKISEEDIQLDIGELPSDAFNNENDYDYSTSPWTFDLAVIRTKYKITEFDGNGVKLIVPVSFENTGKHEVCIYVFTKYQGIIPGLNIIPLKYLIGKEYKIEINVGALEPSISDEAVNFPDPNLEAAIREAINKPEEAIYVADLKGLNSLDALSKDIKDITGLEYCINLQELSLSDNQISDVSPLSGLTNLQELYLLGNQITDVSPLSGLTNLQ